MNESDFIDPLMGERTDMNYNQEMTVDDVNMMTNQQKKKRKQGLDKEKKMKDAIDKKIEEF